MSLFNVVTVYCNKNYVPECKEIVVIKEMPSTYLVEANLASGHRSRISKDDQQISLTEIEAWDKYIRRAKQILMTMGADMTASINNVNHAILERAYLINQQEEWNVKIGGTD